MTLFINACVRKDSRTKRLADLLLAKRGEPYEELRLGEIEFPVVDEAFLIRRDQLKIKEDFSDPVFDLARQFAAAESIVIAAPFWDLSFPASLKQYFEMINVGGVTFCYTIDGSVKGLCRAESLTYVTTAGGDFTPDEFGFGYVRALAQNYYGIQNVRLIKASGLDIAGADAESILRAAEEAL